jgi:NADPH:quinone reductase-like Zn-dependent oxidoreductase
VTGVDGTTKLDTMREAGADHVIDYTQEDFTKSGERYDLILDCAMWRSMFDVRRALNPEGIHVVVGGSLLRIFGFMPLGPLLKMAGSRKRTVILAHQPNKDLAHLAELLEAGNLIPVIDGQYELSELPEAMRRFGEGKVRGKAVITVSGSGEEP